MRKTFLLTCLAVVPAALLASTANTQSIEAAQAAFAEGRFVEAAELAEALKTSEGLTFAAQSLAIHGYHIAEDGGKQALFERAKELAEEAVRLDPENPAAYLQLAHTLGRYTQTVGLMEALDRGYPEKVREALEDALRLKPDMVAAHFSLGSWHAEAYHEGGIMAEMLYGASPKEARAHFEQALELAPHSKITLYQYAYGLLLLDRDSNHEQARELLVRAVEIPSKSTYDRITHELAVDLLEDLKAKPPKPPRHPGRLGQ